MPLLPFGSAPIPNATSSKLGKIQLAGDIAGSATAPTIKASVGLTGVPTAPTASAGDNTTQIATDAFVTTAVSNAIAAVNPAIAVQAATTSASNTSGLTYIHVAGIGDTFTGSINTAIVFDGHTLVSGDRVLIKNDTQTSPGSVTAGTFNGVYTVTQIQTIAVPPILTRATDYDTPSDINNTGAIPVLLGTVNAITSWILTTSITAVGTGNNPLTYAQFSYGPTTIVPPNLGGTGIANNAASTLTISGSFATTLTVTNTTSVTLPTSGTLVNTGVATLSSLVSVGTITTGGLGTGAVIGGTTMTLGSDASYDTYYRSSGGILTRLANGTTGQVLTATTSAAPSWAPASGSGTVTTVSVATANGFSGTVANATTTPAITIIAGAITPTSVNGLTITTSTGTLTIASGKTATINNSLTLAGTDSTTMTFPSSSDTVVTLAATQTLTNKRVTKRTGTTTSSGTPTINTDTVDFYSITALSAAITSFTTNLSGTPTEAQTLWIAITDNGTARAITWGTSFEASGNVPLPTTTVISVRLDVGFVWNTVTSHWRCVAVA